ncbi:MAG: transcription-repair coupling factor [Deltaproteobacteria bacterium]|nr:transcription-repair coupling factor [Deltaproteobacteria bacterium]
MPRVDERVRRIMHGDEVGGHLCGVPAQAAAHLLAEAVDTEKPFVVIVPDNATLESLAADLKFFLELKKTDPAPAILRYPADEVNPFGGLSPDRDDVAERLGSLHLISRGERFGFLLVAAPAVTKRVMPPDVLASAGDYVVPGVEVDRERLIANLSGAGYLRVPVADGPGQFAARGGIVDVFSPLYPHPVRIEFLGDLVDRMRYFEPESQRTFRDAPDVYAPPVSELIATDEGRKAAAGEAATIGERIDTPSRRLSEIQDEIAEAGPGKYPPALLPAFYARMAVLTDFLDAYPPRVRIAAIESEDCLRAAGEFLSEAAQDHATAEASGAPCLPVDRHFAGIDSLSLLIARSGALGLSMLPSGNGETIDLSEAFGNTRDLRDRMERARGRKDDAPLSPLLDSFAGWHVSGREVVAAFPSREQAERLSFLLSERGIAVSRQSSVADRQSPVVLLVPGKLSAGLVTRQRVFITEDDIFGERARRPSPRASLKAAAASLHELKTGDFIVHVQHGIGVYRGLSRLALWGVENDFLQIEYREGSKLYLPVQRMGLVSRYAAPEGVTPRIDRLGTNAWEKTKARVKDAVLAMASEMLRLHALRKTSGGTAFSAPDDFFTEFCASFEFEETPDQLKAVEDVLADMQKPEPMDRLVCGDVGYGKTEVAVRAAFKAVQDGKQAAVLVPTTVLAQQHYRTFRKRFEKFPVSVGLLSRFARPAAQREVAEGLASGTVDVVIGTHRLLQKDVAFKSLGLIVVDEEHRFGVAHKERLKKAAAGVDILTLTATPIPRTLHMALGGLKDLSIIGTPPPDRLSVRTFVAKFDTTTVREAIVHEISRGGQVFFVHDRIMSMPGMLNLVRKLAPEAKVGVAHGRMEPRELEKVMVDFIEQRINVLLCTTIIGAGLDIPTANTILIHRADMLGLSQLYQLRGRVGRGRERAFAYLFVPRFGNLRPDAKRRLETMYEFQQLGSGFNVAMQDMEIRGAGNLLGPHQHGHVAAVGFDLYADLLEEAVSEIKGRPAGETVEPEVRLPVPSFIPEKYIGDVPLRLEYYQKMVYARSPGEIGAIVEEMEDRFGAAPPEILHLADTMSLTTDLRKLDVESLEYGKGNVVLRFAKAARIDPARLVTWVERHAAETQFVKDGRLVHHIGEIPPEDLVRTIHQWVKGLASALGA